MTHIVVHLRTPAQRRGLFAARLARSLHRAMIADGTRRALDELPDNILRDIGLTRSDIRFAPGALSSGDSDANRDAPAPLDGSVTARGGPARRSRHGLLRLALVTVVAVSTFVVFSRAIRAQDAPIARHKHLVEWAGSNDRHRPGNFFGTPTRRASTERHGGP